MGVSASLGIRLLADLRQVFDGRDAVSTEAILQGLTQLDEAPWADLQGNGLNARGLAMRLRQYGVASRQVRMGDRTAKGYRREDLHDAWERYLPPSPPIGKETRETSGTVTCYLGEAAEEEQSGKACPAHGGEWAQSATHFGSASHLRC